MQNMNNKILRLIDSTELQERVLNFISSDEIDKFLSNTIFDGDKMCKQAVIHGMVIASMMTSQCKSIIVNIENENKECNNEAL